MKDNKYKAVKLSDENLAQVVGGKYQVAVDGSVHSQCCQKTVQLDSNGICIYSDSCDHIYRSGCDYYKENKDIDTGSDK